MFMEIRKDADLALELRLPSSAPADGDLLTLMPPSSSSSASLFFHAERAACELPFLRRIDVNRAPSPWTSIDAAAAAGEEEDEEAEADGGASSPNSSLSSLGGKRGRHAGAGEEHDRASSHGPVTNSDDDDGGGAGCRKKLRLSKDQAAVLEERFKEHNTLNPKQKVALAKQLNLRPRQVEVWFQNRRARTKLKQTEVDCEFLKRCCESLATENRRLQKEVAELRALKLLTPTQLYGLRVPPPTTLTMCPACERVSAPPPPSPAAEGSVPHRPSTLVPV